MACPEGYIRRSGYYRNSHVKSTCIPDKGNPGKTPKSRQVLPAIKDPGLLRGYGYSTKDATIKRHTSLDKGVKDKGILYIQRHLILIKNYTPKTEDHYSTLRSDVEYLSKGKPKKKSKRKPKKKSKRKSKRKSKGKPKKKSKRKSKRR